jgi:murein DD-endopeptidase
MVQAGLMMSKRINGYSVLVTLLVAALLCSPGAMNARSKAPEGSRPPAKHFADVRLPRGYRLPAVQARQFKAHGLVVDLYAMSFSQGMAVYAEAYADPSEPGATLEVQKLLIENRDIPVSKRSWGYRALFGLSPDAAAGNRQLVVEYRSGGARRTATFSVAVAAARFEFYPGALDLGKYSDVDYRPTAEETRFINECAKKKEKAFSRAGSDELNSSPSHPRDYHYVTSPFYAKRNIMRYKKVKHKKIRQKDKLNVHRGIDLRGKTGEPLFALARGKVAIAEPMYYEGNFIVIDHGNRVFSCYMHCDKLNVREGNTVQAGEKIGRIGTTGQSTAAHLHVSVFLQDVPVDPLSVLVLPIRD